jgi:hypothetical protein
LPTIRNAEFNAAFTGGESDCDGIGCNGSTKGAYKLSSLGFKTKELLGGLDWWRRDGHAVLSGPGPGDIHQAKKLAKR